MHLQLTPINYATNSRPGGARACELWSTCTLAPGGNCDALQLEVAPVVLFNYKAHTEFEVGQSIRV